MSDLKYAGAEKQQSDEITARELAATSLDRMSIRRAKKLLDQRVEEGVLTKRIIRLRRRKVAVYKPTQKMKRRPLWPA